MTKRGRIMGSQEIGATGASDVQAVGDCPGVGPIQPSERDRARLAEDYT
jgi:hypothetical protein